MNDDKLTVGSSFRVVEQAVRSERDGSISYFISPLPCAVVALDNRVVRMTDSSGSVKVPAGSYKVTASVPGFLPASASVSVGAGQETEVYVVLNRDIPKEERSLLGRALERVGGFLFYTAINFVELASDEWEVIWFTWKGKLIAAGAEEAGFELLEEIRERL